MAGIGEAGARGDRIDAEVRSEEHVGGEGKVGSGAESSETEPHVLHEEAAELGGAQLASGGGIG